MWKDRRTIDIPVLLGLVLQNLNVVIKRELRIFVKIDDADLGSHELRKNDGCAVVDAQVPRRDHRYGAVKVQRGPDPVVLLSLQDAVAVVGALLKV